MKPYEKDFIRVSKELKAAFLCLRNKSVSLIHSVVQVLNHQTIFNVLEEAIFVALHSDESLLPRAAIDLKGVLLCMCRHMC